LFFGLGRLGYDGVIGLAVATSLAAWVNVALLAGTLAREGTYRPGAAVTSRLLRIGAASAIMAAVLGGLALIYPRLQEWLLSKEIAVLAACIGGFVVYGAAVLLLRAVTLAELKGALRRERGAPALPAGPEL
jgi:putative peptidoglycan lipid II flippase